MTGDSSADEPRGVGPAARQPLRARAVLAGVAADYLLTLVATLVLLTLVLAAFAVRGGDVENVDPTLLLGDQLFLATYAVLGTACTGAGGYVAARIAGRDHHRHAMAMGVLSLGLAAGLSLIDEATTPMWYTTAAFLLMVPAAALGGHIAARRAAATQAPSDSSPL
jgi:hypothetical protein